ncbi:STAS domain protein [Gracilibacillus boraciitolerans JCM 21714]|uniref:STAS domain protein n=1 Tax=Gracilibacillus boraciitolerans JCM 21714 TaxID=1298598 RepID=W4VH41_9BACI|nr:STAS domain-containing protein [Gracilibacillus boraciitolerans]GAE92079.1 STAS domain protein [Gracilibacillus boraciitolerans JCM 21714]
MLDNQFIKLAVQIITTHYYTISQSLLQSNDHSNLSGFINNLILYISDKLESNDRDITFRDMRTIGEKCGNTVIDQNFFMNAADLLPLISQHITNYMKKNLETHALTSAEYTVLNGKIDKMILHFNTGFINGFFQRNDMNTCTQQQVLEQSLPIIKIDHQIGVCPLIGKIDVQKSTILINKTVHSVVNEKIKYLILDLTGTGQVEDFGLKQLFKAIRMIELVGTTVIFTGINSKLATSSTLLNVKLNEDHVYQTVRDALISIDQKHQVQSSSFIN